MNMKQTVCGEKISGYSTDVNFGWKRTGKRSKKSHRVNQTRKPRVSNNCFFAKSRKYLGDPRQFGWTRVKFLADLSKLKITKKKKGYESLKITKSWKLIVGRSPINANCRSCRKNRTDRRRVVNGSWWPVCVKKKLKYLNTCWSNKNYLKSYKHTEKTCYYVREVFSVT